MGFDTFDGYITPKLYRHWTPSYVSMGTLAFYGRFIYMMLYRYSPPHCADWRHPHVLSLKEKDVTVDSSRTTHCWINSEIIYPPILTGMGILFISATKIQRICKLCKQIKEKPAFQFIRHTLFYIHYHYNNYSYLILYNI